MFNQDLIFTLFLRNFLSRENIIFKLWNPLVYVLTKMLWKTLVPNFLSKLMYYVIVLAINFQCTSESKPYFFNSCFHLIIADTIIAMFTLTMALTLSGK